MCVLVGRLGESVGKGDLTSDLREGREEEKWIGTVVQSLISSGICPKRNEPLLNLLDLFLQLSIYRF